MNITLLWWLLAVVAGWLAGALANWAADVMPSWGQPAQADNMPTGRRAYLHVWTLGWYLSRHGICPHCGQPRAWRAPAVEGAMMVLFGFMALRFAATPAYLLVTWCYVWYLMTVLVIDLETRRVLNVMLIPAALFAVAVNVVLGTPGVSSMLVGGLVAFGLFFLLYVIGRLVFGRGALGLGDVKLAGVIGLMVGYPDVLRALIFGALLGAVAAIFLLATRRAGLKTTSAYAPYLALGAIIVLWS